MKPFLILAGISDPSETGATFVIIRITADVIDSLRDASSNLADLHSRLSTHGSLNLRGKVVAQVLTDLPAGLFAHAHSELPVVLPEDSFDFLGSGRDDLHTSTECDGFTIHGDTIRFTTYAKHCDDLMETEDLAPLIQSHIAPFIHGHIAPFIHGHMEEGLESRQPAPIPPIPPISPIPHIPSTDH